MISKDLLEILRCPVCVREEGKEGNLKLFKDTWLLCQDCDPIFFCGKRGGRFFETTWNHFYIAMFISDNCLPVQRYSINTMRYNNCSPLTKIVIIATTIPRKLILLGFLLCIEDLAEAIKRIRFN